MKEETLNKGIAIRREIGQMKTLLNSVERVNAVEILFANCNSSCCSSESLMISPEEVNDFKSNITELIRMRAEARLEELEKEFNNL